MIVILKDRADERQVENLTTWLQSMNIGTHISHGSEHTIIGLIGDTSAVDIELLQSLDVVSAVKRIQEPYKNANRKFHEDDTVVELENGAKIGGGHFQMIAGPCSVES
ncbi:MAG: 3-deoxy-7-phosphoheptulonate synthase, partial [Clostridia bacterium]|nr:3-deoxy-7-phosphoheptulonate synthase [Clostridia bacterium]